MRGSAVKERVTTNLPSLIRQRLLEILNSGQYQAPIIVFVNQKKTADMVAKDLSRAGVRQDFLANFMTRADSRPLCSGAPRLYILARTKSNEKLRCSHSAPVPLTC